MLTMLYEFKMFADGASSRFHVTELHDIQKIASIVVFPFIIVYKYSFALHRLMKGFSSNYQ